mgnify:CR=1 FL=1
MNNIFLTRAVAVVAGISVVLLFFVFGNPLAVVEQGLNANAVGSATGQLVVQDEMVGEGAEAVIGSIVMVHYTGTLDNGTVFDTSVGGQPYRFVLGGGQVIPGWDQGIQGMREGGKRLLIIPPELAYGTQGYGPIPPNATLIFQVELVDVAE